MGERIIFNNEYLKIFAQSNDVYIETYKKGFPFEQLNEILTEHPEINITGFIVLRNAINLAPMHAQKFAELKEGINIEILNNKMTAMITYNLPKEELSLKNRENLIRETYSALENAGVVFGIKKEVLSGEILPGRPYVIAEGVPAIDGKDSVIRMYELSEAKPSLHVDGKVNYYDMKLINKVKIGDWLGERIEATDGVPGKNVKGEEIKPVKGKNFPLNYDRNTVREEVEGDKTVLYSKINGAVHFTNGKISVSNHLEIDGDVDLSTGNINFDGYLTIKGTVTDGFSVEATKDIEINGDIGVGNVKHIISKEGSIYIKGGITSKGKAEIYAANNIFTKFVDNAIVTCRGTLNIGYYCINSIINAREVIIDSTNGQIIGGQIKAEVRVSAPIAGSEIEKRTVIEVTGFNRKNMVEELENVLRKINELKIEQTKLKQAISSLEGKMPLSEAQNKEYANLLNRMFSIRESIKELEEKRKNISSYLRARGEGEISITKRIYPNCCLIIKNNIIEITRESLATSYFIQDNEIKNT